MPQKRRKTTKTPTRPKNTSRARSPRQLRDLDERNPSKVKGGITSGGTTGGYTGGIPGISIGKTPLPCI